MTIVVLAVHGGRHSRIVVDSEELEAAVDVGELEGVLLTRTERNSHSLK